MVDTDWSMETTGHEISAHQVAQVADALSDDNPLWLDADFAREHGHPERVAPPTMVDALNPFYAEHPYPVAQEFPYEFSGGDVFELHRPVHVGDVIDVHTSIRSIDERTRSDGRNRIRLVTYEKNYTDAERHEPIATVLWTYVNFEGEPTGGSATAYQAPAGTWESIPDIVDELDIVKIVKWAGAVGDYARIHIDYPFATQERDLKDVVGHGPRTTALLARALTDWLGTAGRIARLETRYKHSTYPGDRLTTKAWVRPAEGDDTSVGAGTDFEARLALVNQDGVAVTTGTATVERSTN